MSPQTPYDEVFVLRDKEFEWDKQKAADNLRKHKISFRVAAAVFFDSSRKSDTDDREDYSEVREWTIGKVKGQLFHVVFTERANRTRIISARKADANDKRRYANAWY